MNDFTLFPEWYEQEAIWLAWPHNTETWTTNELKKVEEEYAFFVQELLEVVKVHLLVKNDEHKTYVLGLLGEEQVPENLYVRVLETNDAWIRDYGPDFVYDKKSGSKVLINWGYNSWGEKYLPFDLDNSIPEQIAQSMGLISLKKEMILEGGSFEVNGVGDLLTTKSCLLHTNRNPLLKIEDIEVRLAEAFGLEKIHWLTEGISGDDTDGHVDDLARFVNEDTILYLSTSDPTHPDYHTLKRIEEELQQIILCSGKKPNLIKLPIPLIVFYEGDILPCSYANFLITNKKVLVPTFNCLQDKEAISTLQRIFKDRVVVGVPSSNIIIGLGSLHCLSKHEFKLA